VTAKCDGNVHDSGVLEITASSVGRPEGYSWFCSENKPGQWICLDFKTIRIEPTHFMIRAGYENYLKSWAVEGSDDGASWTEIDRRENNSDINDWSAVKTFAVWELREDPPAPDRHESLRQQSPDSRCLRALRGGQPGCCKLSKRNTFFVVSGRSAPAGRWHKPQHNATCPAHMWPDRSSGIRTAACRMQSRLCFPSQAACSRRPRPGRRSSANPARWEESFKFPQPFSLHNPLAFELLVPETVLYQNRLLPFSLLLTVPFNPPPQWPGRVCIEASAPKSAFYRSCYPTNHFVSSQTTQTNQHDLTTTPQSCVSDTHLRNTNDPNRMCQETAGKSGSPRITWNWETKAKDGLPMTPGSPTAVNQHNPCKEAKSP
jgi:hypothetical protein